MRAQRIPLILLVSLLVAAPLSAGAESDGETLTTSRAVALYGTSSTDLTESLSILYEPGTSTAFTGTAGTLSVHKYTVRVAPCTNPLNGCIPSQSGTPQYTSETLTLTDARVTLTRADTELRGFIATDPRYAMTPTQAGPGWSTVTVAGPAFIGYPETNTTGPFNSHGWTAFPNYEVRNTEAEFGHLGEGDGETDLTLGGWFQLTLFGYQFKLEGVNKSSGKPMSETRESSAIEGGSSGFMSPFVGNGGSFTFYVLEFDGAAAGTFRTTGKFAHYKPQMEIREQGGRVVIDIENADGADYEETRSGDLLVTVQKVEGWKPLLTLTVAPLAAAPPGTDAPDGPLGEPAVVGAAAAVTLAATLAALVYWWPQFKYALTALALPMYTRIAKDDVLSHGTRDYIYDLIKEAPGIHAHEISSRANIGWGTAVYHLKLLESHRMVVGKRDGRYKRFFVNDGRLSSKKEAYGILRNETSSQVAQFILNNPGCNQKDLCAALGMQPSLANWHTGKLEEAHLVKKIKEGRMVRYFAGPAWSEMQLPGFTGAATASLAASGGAIPAHAAPDLIGGEN